MIEKGGPQIGDIWREVDHRFCRRVQVLALKGKRVQIATGYWGNDGQWKVARKTHAALRRFNGRHGGYELETRPRQRIGEEG